MSDGLAQAARALVRHARERSEVTVAQREPRYAEVRQVTPLAAELTTGELLLENEDLLLPQWVKRYRAEVGIVVGDTLWVAPMDGSEWTVIDVVADSSGEPVAVNATGEITARSGSSDQVTVGNVGSPGLRFGLTGAVTLTSPDSNTLRLNKSLLVDDGATVTGALSAASAAVTGSISAASAAVTGNISAANPTTAGHLATKSYTDTAVAAEAATRTAAVTAAVEALETRHIHLPLAGRTWATTTGTWTTVGDASAIYSVYTYNSSNTQNDEIGWDVNLAAGTWQLELLHIKNTMYAIATVALDGTTVGTIDMYSAPTFNLYSSISGITVATSGKKRLTFKAATRNASSTGWVLAITAWTLRRTA